MRERLHQPHSRRDMELILAERAVRRPSSLLFTSELLYVPLPIIGLRWKSITFRIYNVPVRAGAGLAI